MAVYSFSTKDTKPTDAELIDKIKQHCNDNSLNFSSVVVKQLAIWWEQNKDER